MYLRQEGGEDHCKHREKNVKGETEERLVGMGTGSKRECGARCWEHWLRSLVLYSKVSKDAAATLDHTTLEYLLVTF